MSWTILSCTVFSINVNIFELIFLDYFSQWPLGYTFSVRDTQLVYYYKNCFQFLFSILSQIYYLYIFYFFVYFWHICGICVFFWVSFYFQLSFMFCFFLQLYFFKRKIELKLISPRVHFKNIIFIFQKC